MHHSHRIAVLAAGFIAAALQTFAALEPVEFVGCMTYALSWDSRNPKYGFYSFNSDGSHPFMPVSQIDSDSQPIAYAGGAYGQGRYVCYDVTGTYKSYQVTFYEVDTQTWAPTRSIAMEENYKYVPVDLTYDYRSEKFYAICKLTFGNGDSGYLCEVDTESGELHEIGTLEKGLRNFAADAQGQFWGIAADGKLYRIAKDGTLTLVAQTQYRPTDENQGATIDFRTGRYFWASNAYDLSMDKWYNYTFTQLLSVDLENPEKPSPTWNFDYMEQVTGLAVLNTHPDAPDNIEDLTFEPTADGALEAGIRFTVPARTYAQQTLTGNVQVTVTLDGKVLETRTATPGETVSLNTAIEGGGNHSASVTLVQGDLQSLTATAVTYFGVDAPSPVTTLTLTADADRSTATLTWEAPELGTSGGYLDPERLTYRVVRQPEGITVAKALKATSFTETFTDREMRPTVYDVYACIDGTESKRCRSNRENVGTPCSLPFIERFDTQDGFNRFFVIDADNNGIDAFESHMWRFDEEYLAAFYYGIRGVNADDWLITPALNLDPDRVYRLNFQTYGYQGWDNRLQIAVGPRPETEALTRLADDYAYQSTMQNTKMHDTYITVRPGDRYVGFHNVSTGGDHMSIDNVLIEDYCSALIPDTVTHLAAATDADGRAFITFEMPVQNVRGDKLDADLEVEIFRADGKTMAGNLRNLRPGETVRWTDPLTAQGLNIYRIRVKSAQGEGLFTAVSIDLTQGTAAALDDVKACYINAHDIQLTWKPLAQTADAEGRPIDPENVCYTVYRDGEMIASGLEECRYTDREPAAGMSDENGTLRYADYKVSAVTAGGEGEKTAANFLMVGTPYSLPFSETWQNQAESTWPWTRLSSNYSGWTVVSTGYDPFALGEDGAGLISCGVDTYYASIGWGQTQTPSISFADAAMPHLSFSLYHAPEYSTSNSLQVGYIVEGADTAWVSPAYFCCDGEKGWQRHEIDLPALAGQPRASVIFKATMAGQQNTIHLDRVEITAGEAVDHELMLADLLTPSSTYRGLDEDIEVNVRNLGNLDLRRAATVSFSIDGTETDTRTIAALPAGSDEALTFLLETAALEEGVHTLALKLTSDEDKVVENNTLEATIEILPANIPAPTGLVALRNAGDDGSVELRWQAPDESPLAESLVEGFEGYEAFAISDILPWTLYDGDEAYPYLFADINGSVLEWPNNRELQAFMVFNPKAAGLDGAFNAYEGEQCLINWAAAGNRNDDWLISPRLDGHKQIVSFYVRGVDSQDNDETYDVLVSYTDDDPDSFISLCGVNQPVATADWQLVHFALPEGTRYFAVRYTAALQKGIMVDRIHYRAAPHLPIAGYNVYCDGERLNNTLVKACSYNVSLTGTDTETAFTVRAVVAERGEGPDSEAAHLDDTGINTLNAAAHSVVRRFTPDGRRTGSSAHGVVIEQLSDGSVRKTIR
ncbi:MAG: choice-of-anchor J domain-containing protein [Alloprevotella sp.]